MSVYIGFDVLGAAFKKVYIFWDISAYRLLNIYGNSGGAFYLHLQG
jgi:hypothetical protein